MILRMIYWAFFVIIMARVVLSVGPEYWQWRPLGRLILRITDPLLAPFRRLGKPISITPGISVDFSPMLFLCTLSVLFYVLRLLNIQF